MGYEMRNIREIRIGDMSIDISGHPEITEFIYDEEPVKKYIDEQLRPAIKFCDNEISFTVQINRIAVLKLSGTWDWVIENCPDKRVKHLIKHHKDDRVKMKNWRHAAKLIGKILEA